MGAICLLANLLLVFKVYFDDYMSAPLLMLDFQCSFMINKGCTNNLSVVVIAIWTSVISKSHLAQYE